MIEAIVIFIGCICVILTALALIAFPFFLLYFIIGSIWNAIKGDSNNHHTPGIIWFDALF